MITLLSIYIHIYTYIYIYLNATVVYIWLLMYAFIYTLTYMYLHICAWRHATICLFIELVAYIYIQPMYIIYEYRQLLALSLHLGYSNWINIISHKCDQVCLVRLPFFR